MSNNGSRERDASKLLIDMSEAAAAAVVITVMAGPGDAVMAGYEAFGRDR